MAPKSRLGRGLDALLSDGDDEAVQSVFGTPSDSFSRVEAGSAEVPSRVLDAQGSQTPPSAVPQTSGLQAAEILTIPLDKLKANPGQPRKRFEEESLRELADSIAQLGIIQPLIVEEAGDGTWLIVAGERRSRAAHLAGLTEVPVIVRSYSDEKRMEVALIENVQRSDLNPIEEAAAYRQIMDITGCSQDEVAVKVGRNRSTVANALRLLKLPPLIREALERDEITSGHGRAILSVQEEANQEQLYREISVEGLSVREAEKRAAALNKPRPEKAAPAPAETERRDPELAAMEQRFIDRLGTKVAIKGDFKKGNIQIEYYSMDDLDRLLGILG
ncbi:chromosome-partitioning protein ParB [Treponema primitia ZAS-2]|uniref:Chromosome-partitioning protein ParB n=1 Tax=Treponema primitia (strain ATCC BAA-887 / DSM 12427 / ZAS-2) TaxID=545694 RepID=F5YQI2_TREPZ|nr:ParB/RepB/Spo0J family partition protein [Treponema primitia]AEF85621.1 chromosome-partitioning protein ParB [Treponema primitia ZAS-2]